MSLPYKTRRYYNPSTNVTVATNQMLTGQVQYANALGFLTLGGCSPCDGQRYFLDSFRMVVPAEHTLHGKQYPAELQLRHVSEKSAGIIISSIFFYKQADGGFLNSFMSSVKQNTADNTVPVDPSVLREALHGEYFIYKGSDYAPSCTEGVTRIVYKTPLGLDNTQLTYVQGFTTYKSSSPKPLNGRPITWYRKPLY